MTLSYYLNSIFLCILIQILGNITATIPECYLSYELYMRHFYVIQTVTIPTPTVEMDWEGINPIPPPGCISPGKIPTPAEQALHGWLGGENPSRRCPLHPFLHLPVLEQAAGQPCDEHC